MRDRGKQRQTGGRRVNERSWKKVGGASDLGLDRRSGEDKDVTVKERLGMVSENLKSKEREA